MKFKNVNFDQERIGDSLISRHHSYSTTSRKQGPCTPLILVISMSAVADGPEVKVVGRVDVMRSRSMASGTDPTTEAGSTRHTW